MFPESHQPGRHYHRIPQLHVSYSAYLTWHTKRQSRKLGTRFLTSCRTKHRTLSDITITCSRNASSRTDTVPTCTTTVCTRHWHRGLFGRMHFLRVQGRHTVQYQRHRSVSYSELPYACLVPTHPAQLTATFYVISGLNPRNCHVPPNACQFTDLDALMSWKEMNCHGACWKCSTLPATSRNRLLDPFYEDITSVRQSNLLPYHVFRKPCC